MKLRALTNVRPTKDLGKQVILAPTEGGFKITPDAATLLKVGAGDYVGIAYDDEAQVGYVFKGDENGLGAKVASTNKGGGGILGFSAAAGWVDLKGDSENNTHYDIVETPVDSADLEGTPFEGKTLYPLTFVEKVAKQVRTTKKAEDKAVSTEVDAPQTETSEVTDSDFGDL